MTISLTPKFLVYGPINTGEAQVHGIFESLQDARALAANVLVVHPGKQMEIYQLLEVNHTTVSEVKIASLFGEQ